MDVDQSALTGKLKACSLEPRSPLSLCPQNPQVNEESVDVDQSALTRKLKTFTLEPR